MQGERSTEDVILDATLEVLASKGIAGVSMRAVARAAGVAVGLTNYYFATKTELISAALRRVADQDALLVAPVAEGQDPAAHLRASLRRTLDPEYLDPGYLSLRLQLWSLAGVDVEYAAINREGQERYLAGLASQIGAACPELGRKEAERRASDVLIVQNGVWLTAILITDQAAIDRAIDRCYELALSPEG